MTKSTNDSGQIADGWPFDASADYRRARAFDLEASEDVARRLYKKGLKPLLAHAEHAIATLDLARLLGAGRVLDRHGALTHKVRVAYAEALLQEGEYAAACRLLRQVTVDAPGVANYAYALATGLAATGRFSDAINVASAISASWPKAARASALAELCEATEARWRRRGELAWDEWVQLLDGCLQLKASEAARQALGELFNSPPSQQPTRDEALAVARIGHAVRLRDRRLWKLIKQLWRSAPDDPAVRAARIQSLVMWSQPEAVELARERRPVSPESPKTERLALAYASAAALVVAGDLEPAIRLLGGVYTSSRVDFSVYNALQDVMGRYVLSRLELPWAPPRPPKVINLVPYFRERTLLEMRLAEMGDWVDHFVIVEATTTFTGAPKPLHFEADAGMFADRGDQLLHVAVRDMPACCNTAWARDLYQRDMGVSALAGRWRPDDIILITDADEIIDRRALEGFRARLAAPRMVTGRHFLNYLAAPGNTQADRRSGAVCEARVLRQFGSTYLRALAAGGKHWDTVPSAGWHFTSLGDAAAVVAKFNAYAHQERNKAGLRSEDDVSPLLERIRSGYDEPGWQRTPIDDRFPAYVRDQRAMLSDLILEAAATAANPSS